ncbi:MAG: hypothetical protein KC561_07970 [Myxococcales bacterium]|nr:hypothetical protein [Myxococcales bacterium]
MTSQVAGAQEYDTNSTLVVFQAATTQAEAQSLLEQYIESRLPQYGAYPRLEPGLSPDQPWWVVVGDFQSEDPATELAAFCAGRDFLLEAIPQPDRIGQEGVAVGSVLSVRSNATPGDEAWQYVGPVRLVANNEVLGEAQPADDGHLVILYPSATRWTEPASLAAGGSFDFPYMCDDWTVPAPDSDAFAVTLPLSTSSCMMTGD